MFLFLTNRYDVNLINKQENLLIILKMISDDFFSIFAV